MAIKYRLYISNKLKGEYRTEKEALAKANGKDGSEVRVIPDLKPGLLILKDGEPYAILTKYGRYGMFARTVREGSSEISTLYNISSLEDAFGTLHYTFHKDYLTPEESMERYGIPISLNEIQSEIEIDKDDE